jgi:hypothetical protein
MFMFNFDQAITEWRRQMTAGGIKNSAVLDELESHVREDVERQMRSGGETQKAFEVAVKKIGPASALRNEFKKSVAAMVAEKLMIAMAVLVVAFGIFLCVVTILFCYLSLAERLVGVVAMTLTVATACAWPAFVSRLPVIRPKRKLYVAQILCLAAGFGLCTLHIQLVVNRFAYTDGMVPAAGFFGIFFIALGFAAAAGLDRAARKGPDEIMA